MCIVIKKEDVLLLVLRIWVLNYLGVISHLKSISMYNFVNCFIMNFYSKSERSITLLKGFIIPYICVEMNEICKDYIFVWC